MRKIYAIFLAVLVSVSAFAQTPQKMSYQAVIRNASNALVTSHAVGMRISILKGSATGTPVYVETQTQTTNANGLVTIEIGGGTIVTGTFAAIDWSAGSYFIKTETDPTGGTSYTITGTSQLLSVPYAMYSKTAGNGFSGNYNDLTSKPVFFDGTWSSLSAKPSFAIVATSGNYNDLTNTPTIFNGTWANITGKPTTLSGYGITDAMNILHAANGITLTLIGNWNTAYSWGNHAGLYRPIGYVPAWSEIISKPTTVVGFGITDAVATTGNQIIAGNKTFSGTTTVVTPVNATDATNKAYVDALKTQIQALEDNLIATGTYKLLDIEGNQYKVVKIGTQLWMGENLKTTKYSNGEVISSGIYAPNNDANNVAIYGRLYTWNVLNDSRNICPTGWHVASEAEWNILFSNVTSPAELKESGTSHWLSPNTGATNSVSFTALPGGYFDFVTTGFRTVAAFWFKNELDANTGRGFKLYYNNVPDTGDYVNALKIAALSVRCTKD